MQEQRKLVDRVIVGHWRLLRPHAYDERQREAATTGHTPSQVRKGRRFRNKYHYSHLKLSFTDAVCWSWLAAFTKMWKVTICFIVFLHVEQLSSRWTDFREIWYLNIFWKSVKKIQVSLKMDKNSRYFTWRPIYIFDHMSLNSSQNEKCIRQNL
jgi:hypothetical protein